jgi:hypothetical protein
MRSEQHDPTSASYAFMRGRARQLSTGALSAHEEGGLGPEAGAAAAAAMERPCLCVDHPRWRQRAIGTIKERAELPVKATVNDGLRRPLVNVPLPTPWIV